MIWLQRLGSMKLAVWLLVVLSIVLAAGTIVESLRGRDAAQVAVYATWWFYGLIAIFAVNILASAALLWPWGARRIGFLLTHGALVLIVLGAAMTWLWNVDAHIAIWEGEAQDTIVLAPDRPGDPERTMQLPFKVRLESFEIDYYEGTRRPAMFRSRVVVEDAAAGATVPAVIQMNHGLSYGGYHFYQSSYQQTPDRDMTVLSVSRDPGMWVAFAGYALLLAGMLTVLGTRISQARALASAEPRRVIRSVSRSAALAVAGLVASVAGGSAVAGVVDAPTADRLRRVPVQHDGRVMPLDTVAREAVWSVTGKRTWQGIDETALVLDWAFDQRRWETERIVKLGGDRLAAAIGYPPGTKYAAFGDLARNATLRDLVTKAQEANAREEKLSPLLEDVQSLQSRLEWMYSVLSGSIFRVVPGAVPGDTWRTLDHLHDAKTLLAMLDARPAGWPAPEAIEREILYNRVRPARVAWIVLVLSLLISGAAWRTENVWLDRLALVALSAAFGVMTWGIWIRWQIAGRVPASNMYESLLFLGWGVGLFALAAFAVLKNRLVVFNAAAMAALTMALTDLLPIDGFIHPVAPVLSGTVWLAIHVPIIMVSYAVLALGVLFAHMQIGVGILAPKRQDLVARMADLQYWYTHVGVIFLIAGILTGSVWASSSWGRYWGWDPKEVWSLVAFLVYIAILHARFARLIGEFWVAALSIVAFWTVLMTYVGVNFVLAAGLHSYGFGSSAVVNWFAAVAVLEAAFLVFGWWSSRKQAGTGGLPVRA